MRDTFVQSPFGHFERAELRSIAPMYRTAMLPRQIEPTTFSSPPTALEYRR